MDLLNANSSDRSHGSTGYEVGCWPTPVDRRFRRAAGFFANRLPLLDGRPEGHRVVWLHLSFDDLASQIACLRPIPSSACVTIAVAGQPMGPSKKIVLDNAELYVLLCYA